MSNTKAISVRESRGKKAASKFRVGQVVAHNGIYRKIGMIEFYGPTSQYRYFFGGRQYPFFEEDLRPLTARERGK